MISSDHLPRLSECSFQLSIIDSFRLNILVLKIMGDTPLSDEEKVAIIKRQTDIGSDEIVSLLEEHRGDHMAVIRSYIGGCKEENVAKPPASLNQQIYSNIRTYLDSHTKELLK